MGSPRFTEEDLYGRDRRPHAHDIQQDNLNDCYLVAPLGSIAALQPDRIRDAIRYDQATATFNVTLHQTVDGRTERVNIAVSQDDLRDNLRRGGGSTVDNDLLGLRDGPIWPAVMETAYARLRGGNAAGDLSEGYRRMEGGYTEDAVFALTGDRGDNIYPSSGRIDPNALAQRIGDGLAQGRPVTLSTRGESGEAQDGVRDQHAYMVEGVTRNRDGDPILQLRNPMGHNRDTGEGRDTREPTTEVNLREMIERGGFGAINIGPGPQQTPTREAPYDPNGPSKSGNRHVDNLLDTLGDPAAMRHAMAALAQSPEGQAFRAEGQALWQAQQQPAQAPRSHEPIALPTPNEEPAPRVMRMQ